MILEAKNQAIEEQFGQVCGRITTILLYQTSHLVVY